MFKNLSYVHTYLIFFVCISIFVFSIVNIIQDAYQDLETESDERKLGKLHEVIADNSVELGLYNKAVEHYINVVSNCIRGIFTMQTWLQVGFIVVSMILHKDLTLLFSMVPSD